MDTTTNLLPDIAAFWYHRGVNRDDGIKFALFNEPVSFKDFMVDDQEINVGTPTYLKSMNKDVSEIIKDISDTLPIKTYISKKGWSL